MSAPFEPGAVAQNPRAEADPLPRRILLVEGSEQSRAVMLALLRRPGSEIAIADGAAAALGRLQQERFDLILIEMQFPALDGYEVARRIRARELQGTQTRVPIIALTADTSREQARRCFDAGCDARVAKPPDEQALFEAIRSCTEALGIEAVPELADLLPDYLAHRRADVDALWQAIAGGNWALVSRLGHDMKGSGQIYGLPRISAIGARIEASGTANERREALLALAALESFLARAARSLVDPAAPSGTPGISAPGLPFD